MRESLVLYSEPLLDPEFAQFQHIAPLAERLTDRFEVSIAAPAIGVEAGQDLTRRGIVPISAGHWYPNPRSSIDEAPAFVVSWIRDVLAASNGRWTSHLPSSADRIRVNFSMTNCAPSDLWYVQSQPLVDSVRAMVPNFSRPFRWAGKIGVPIVGMLGSRHLARTASSTGKIYTSTRYVGNAYRRLGYPVAGQIPVFLSPSTFAPTTWSPARDYALTYLGKETDIQALRGLVGMGIPMKVFGGKSADLVKGALGDPLPAGVEMCGRVSHEQLRALYSNALFTAFPFTDESFGNIPVESMACGTPVLTYATQGPGETVVDGFTGWLARSPVEFLEAARRLFDRGYPRGIQSACVERAEEFSLDTVSRHWRQVLRSLIDGVEPGEWPSRGVVPSPSVAAESFLSIRELVEAY